MDTSSDKSGASAIPSECWSVVASYLSLTDCLKLGSTSLSALRDIQPDLARRRRHMTQTFYYSDLEQPDVYSSYKLKENKGSDEHVVYHELPTVRDRVECLYSFLSPSCRLHDAVRELLLDMNETCNNDDTHKVGADTTFSDVFVTLQKNMKSHKLHASILASAIQSGPRHYDGSVRSASQRTVLKNVLTVTLQRYMGDVMCASFLMGHAVSGIVEGGPTEQGWIKNMLSELGCHDEPLPPNATPWGNDNNSSITASTYYRVWILLHSSVLRVAPFTRKQQLQLGIASQTVPGATSLMPKQDDAGPLLPPHFPFCGMDKKPVMHRLVRRGALESLRVKFNDFGRLGPTFRGRDLIQSQTIYPNIPIGSIVAFDGMPTVRYTNPAFSSSNPFLARRIAGDDESVACLLHLHQEAQKTRPMTVEPHLVTIRCSG